MGVVKLLPFLKSFTKKKMAVLGTVRMYFPDFFKGGYELKFSKPPLYLLFSRG